MQYIGQQLVSILSCVDCIFSKYLPVLVRIIYVRGGESKDILLQFCCILAVACVVFVLLYNHRVVRWFAGSGIMGLGSGSQAMGSGSEISGSGSTLKATQRYARTLAYVLTRKIPIWDREIFLGIMDHNIGILGSGINVTGSYFGITMALAYYATTLIFLPTTTKNFSM